MVEKITPTNETEARHEKKANFSLRSKVKEKFLKFSSESTAHAIPFIFEKDRHAISRLFWIVCLLASTAGCAYLVLISINKYFEFDVTNKIHVYYPSSTEFPTISLCNSNAFLTDVAFDYVQKKLEENNITEMVNTTNFGTMSTGISTMFTNLATIRYMAAMYTRLPNVNTTTRKSYGYSLDKTLLYCTFIGVECTPNDFSWFHTVDYGNCWSFNSGYDGNGNARDIAIVNKPGPIDGLNMFLYLGISDDERSLSKDYGAHMFIHNNSVKTGLFEGFSVGAGVTTNIVINRVFQNYLPSPYNDCYENLDTVDAYDSDLYRFIIKSNNTYRKRDCFWLCYQQKVLENCKCYDLGVSSLYSDNPCLTTDQLICLNKIYYSFYGEEVDRTCSQKCPLECSTVYYGYSVNFQTFPSPALVKYLAKVDDFKLKFPNQSITYDFVKNNFAYVNIYYDEIKYTLMEESPSMEIMDLIANVGGTLGLFVGVSFLSFAEIFELLFEICLYSIFKVLCKKPVYLNERSV